MKVFTLMRDWRLSVILVASEDDDDQYWEEDGEEAEAEDAVSDELSVLLTPPMTLIMVIIVLWEWSGSSVVIRIVFVHQDPDNLTEGGVPVYDLGL